MRKKIVASTPQQKNKPLKNYGKYSFKKPVGGINLS